MRRIVMLFGACAMLAALSVQARSCLPGNAISSSVRTAAVMELFTSEGCDSCPPADRWFSTLNATRDDLVLLAFHVDYWDYIGWKDRFAQPAFSNRQRESVRRHRGQVAYTPQVLVDGQDASRWASPSRVDEAIARAARRPPAAVLNLQAAVSGDALNIELKIRPTRAPGNDIAAFIAVTESGLDSRVTAGENRGTMLRHDHVVRVLAGPFAPVPNANAGEWSVAQRVPVSPDWKRTDLEISAFVQDFRTGEMLQAVRLPECVVVRR